MSKSDQLVLQCLRISLPTLKSPAHDILQEIFQNEYYSKPDPTSSSFETDETFQDKLTTLFSPKLCINEEPGNLLIGEKFQMLLRLVNNGNKECKNISITVDLTIDKFSYHLYESPKDLQLQASNDHIFSVNHTVSYAGQYTMYCNIKGNVDKKSFSLKKQYKFTSTAPFKVTNCPYLYNNITFVQVSVTNCSDKSLALLDAKLNNISSAYKLITPKSDTHLHYFRPFDIFNLIFQLNEVESQYVLGTVCPGPFAEGSNDSLAKSNRSGSADSVEESDPALCLSLDWVSESSGQCKFIVPLKIKNQQPLILFRVIKTPQILNVPAYFDVKFEIKNEGTDKVYCKILLHNLSLDETVEAPIEAGMIITQTYKLHLEQTGLISLDSIRLLTWKSSPNIVKEYSLLNPPSIVCL